MRPLTHGMMDRTTRDMRGANILGALGRRVLRALLGAAPVVLAACSSDPVLVPVPEGPTAIPPTEPGLRAQCGDDGILCGEEGCCTAGNLCSTFGRCIPDKACTTNEDCSADSMCAGTSCQPWDILPE